MSRISFFFKDSKPFSQLVGLVFIFLLCFIAATGVQMLFPQDSTPQIKLVGQGCAQLVMFLLPAVLFATLYNENGVSDYLHLKAKGRDWTHGFVAMVIFLLLVPAIDWLSVWNDSWTYGKADGMLRQMAVETKQAIEQLLAPCTVGDLVLQIVVVALIPAIVEECFFRGASQQTLQRCFGGNAHVAIVVTAILFSLAHGDAYGLVPRLLLGVALGYLFYLSGSMVVNVCAHFFNNVLLVIMYYLYHNNILSIDPASPLLLPWGTTVLCTIGAMMLFIVYFTPIAFLRVKNNR